MQLNVFASDVDRGILERGREGIYSRDSIKNISEEDLDAFFVEEDGSFRVGDEIRKVVSFRTGDILKDRPGGKQSLIVCRNLLIYFSRENQERIITRFSRILHQGGYLMLGKAETLIGRNRLYFQSVSPTERIYRLRDAPLSDVSISSA